MSAIKIVFHNEPLELIGGSRAICATLPLYPSHLIYFRWSGFSQNMRITALNGPVSRFLKSAFSKMSVRSREGALMRLLHKCESKVYGAKEARQHPHGLDPSICAKGWRAATEREKWESENYIPADAEQPNGQIPGVGA